MIMDTFRMRRLIQLTAVLVISMCCANVLAEPIDWPPGKAPSVSLENKIGQSTGAAHIIVVGSIELPQGKPAMEPFAKDEAFLTVKFAIADVLKGDAALRGRTIELKLPIVMPDTASATAPLSDAQIKSAAQALQKAERDYEARTLDEGGYKNALQKSRGRLVRSSSYLQQFVLVPLRAGGLDVTHRPADVLMKPGESYVLMLLKDVSAGAAAQAVFPWELDVYAAADPQQMSLVRKSTGQRQ